MKAPCQGLKPGSADCSLKYLRKAASIPEALTETCNEADHAVANTAEGVLAFVFLRGVMVWQCTRSCNHMVWKDARCVC